MINSEVQLKFLCLRNTCFGSEGRINLVSGDRFWSRSFSWPWLYSNSVRVINSYSYSDSNSHRHRGKSFIYRELQIFTSIVPQKKVRTFIETMKLKIISLGNKE